MLSQRFLNGVTADPFEGLPGVYAVDDYRGPRSWRYICSYSDGKRYKERIFSLLRRHGQPEIPAEWDLHHVVEGQHFADVDFGGEIERLYRDGLPCVLIHKPEHIAYNQLLHIKETDEMFRDQLPRDLQLRSRAALDAAKDRRRHPELRTRVSALEKLYHHTYQGDAVLQRISKNVFAEALRRLL